MSSDSSRPRISSAAKVSPLAYTRTRSSMPPWSHDVDVSHEFPKALTDEAVEASDVVITMGCGDACPVFPGKRYLDWELPDPSGLPVEAVRPIRDEIDARVRALAQDLLG